MCQDCERIKYAHRDRENSEQRLKIESLKIQSVIELYAQLEEVLTECLCECVGKTLLFFLQCLVLLKGHW